MKIRLRNIFVASLLLITSVAFAQINIHSTNPLAEQIMLGNYNPSTYYPNLINTPPKQIVQSLLDEIRTDSLKNYLIELSRFQNRNTASDTVSSTKGIGATRKWIYAYFDELKTQRSGRLIPSYLSFTQDVCGRTFENKNIFAVLPGTDTVDKSIMIIEAHVDSRCEDVCDTACVALGMEDNASGTALVMELARVMSRHTYKNTLVFLITIGEEQGLWGANAFAEYCNTKKIKISAVQNNDVIGGIICGKTSSAPGCPGENEIDSLNVRLFSNGKNLSAHKSFARYVKQEYKDELLDIVPVKMNILIMSNEDRTGRGGDHIPFRQNGYTAIRFTSSYEHGDANPVPSYTDRQHSVRDILGVDTDNNQIVDSFFVDFNYLKRNAVINGTSMAMAAQGVEVPVINLVNDNKGLLVNFTTKEKYKKYLVGVRTKVNDFDKTYIVEDALSLQIPEVKTDTTYFISVAAIDSNGVESLFSEEKQAKVDLRTGIKNQIKGALEFLPTQGLYTDENIIFSVQCNNSNFEGSYAIDIKNISGKTIDTLPFYVKQGMNEISYYHGYKTEGLYLVSLVRNNQIIKTQKVIFTK